MVRMAGDVNGDGRVDLRDMQLVIEAVGAERSRALHFDVDGDGRVSVEDFRVVLANVGRQATYSRTSGGHADGDPDPCAGVIAPPVHGPPSPTEPGPHIPGNPGEPWTPGTGQPTTGDPTTRKPVPRMAPNGPLPPLYFGIPRGGVRDDDPCDETPSDTDPTKPENEPEDEDPCEPTTKETGWNLWVNSDDDDFDGYIDFFDPFIDGVEDDWYRVKISPGQRPSETSVRWEEWSILYPHHIRMYYREDAGDILDQAEPPVTVRHRRARRENGVLVNYIWYPSGTWIRHWRPGGQTQPFSPQTFWVEAVWPTTYFREASLTVYHQISYRNAQGAYVVQSFSSDPLEMTISELSIMQPYSQAGQVEDAFYRAIGHWGADRSGTNELTGYVTGPSHALINGAGGTFIDEDPDRFFVMLVRPSANEDPNIVDSVNVGVVTRSSYGATSALLDSGNTLRLVETSANSSVFMSEANLLTVAESVYVPGFVNPDDGHHVWSARTSGVVADGAMHDRTQRAVIEGATQAVALFPAPKCSQGWLIREVQRPVSEQRREMVPPYTPFAEGIREVRIRVRVHLEPYQDIGFELPNSGPPAILIDATSYLAHHVLDGDPEWFYDANQNGVRDQGEWRILVHEGDVLPPDARRMKFSVDLNDNGAHDANEPYCDRGFEFLDVDGDGVHDVGERSEPYRDLSNHVWLSLPPDWRRGDAMPLPGEWGQVVASAQIGSEIARARISWSQAAIQVSQVGEVLVEHAPEDLLAEHPFGWFVNQPANHDHRVIAAIGNGATYDVVEVIFTGPMSNALGYARPPANQGSSLALALQENSYIFMSPNLDVRHRTLSHELGHVLANRGDSPSTPYIFFPWSPPSGWVGLPPIDDTVLNWRRIRHVTESDARTERAALQLTDPGNRLLQVP
jgi:hypothetical protein